MSVLHIFRVIPSFYSWRFKNKREKQNKTPYFLHSQLLKHNKYLVFLPGQKNKIQVQEHLSPLTCYFYTLNIRILCLLVIYFFKNLEHLDECYFEANISCIKLHSIHCQEKRIQKEFVG